MGGKLGIALQFTENRAKQSMSQSFPCLTSQDCNLCKIKGKAQLKNCVLTIRLCQLTLQLCWGLPGAVEQNSEVGENSCSPIPVLTLLSDSDSGAGLQGLRRKPAHQQVSKERDY